MEDNRKEMFSIATLKDGAAIEMIDEELQRVWDNIQDPNTDAGKSRKVVFSIEVKPDKERELAQVFLNVDARLAPCKSQEAKVALGIDRGKAVAVEYRSKQRDIDDMIADSDNVAQIGGE